MAEQTTRSPQVIPLALAEPTDPVSKGWIGSLGLVSLVMWMAALTPANFLIPAQLELIDPKGAKLALGPAALAGVIAPLLVHLGGYPLLFAATAVVAVAGSAGVWKIKSVP